MPLEHKAAAGVSFYLGANTPGGFFSLFDELYDPAGGWLLYIVKGGPGTGKSSLMKKIAAEADKRGLYCERIFCSSDPASLDGVIIPSLKVSIADGTSPHVLEPKYPGVSEVIVDLGAFRDDARLRKNAGEILRLTEENRLKHAACTRFLNAAGSAGSDMVRMAAGALDPEKLESFLAHLSAREFGEGAGGEGTVRRRFLSAVTPLGVHTFYETAEALAERKIVLHDDIGLCSALILESLREKAAARGYHIYQCLCPLAPKQKTDHLLIPELSLGVFTSNRSHPFSAESGSNVQCARFLGKNEMRRMKNRMSFTRKAQAEMLREALARLKEAKALHDALEAYYIDAMDFDSLGEYAETLIGNIFAGA